MGDCLDARFREALFKWLNIREVSVKLHRIDDAPQTPKKLLLSTIKTVSARSHVPWLPDVASTSSNSASAYSALENHQTGKTNDLN